MIVIKAKTIVHIGDINSVFSEDDLRLLAKDFTVIPVGLDLIGKSYFRLMHSALFQILPGIISSDVSVTWTADIHTAYVVAVSKILDKPSIVIVGGYEVCNMPEIHYGLQSTKIRGRITRWVLQNATKIIVPSNAYKQKVEELVGVVPEVVYNSSEIPEYPCEPKLPVVVMIAGQYGNADDFMALKGLITYDAIAKAMPHISFYLIGNVDDDIKQRCNSITVLGRKNREEIAAILNTTKVYCQLSYTESLGVALLEAIQFGCVPVVTDKDGMAEMVQENGYKIKYGDIVAGVSAVTSALNDTTDRTELISSERAKYSKEQRRINFKRIIESLGS